jgi:uncharacterized protein (TIGR01777 family)
MRVAVTGATGFIGRRLVVSLLRDGHEVVALCRRPDSQRAQFPPGVTLRPFDLGAPPAPGLLSGCEAVVHLAAQPVARRWTKAYKDEILSSRRNGTFAIATASAEAKVGTLITASATGFYGDRQDEALTEASAPGKDFLARVCQIWEAATLPARDAKVRVVPLRIGIVLHPEGGALQRLLVPFRLGVGGKLGAGTQFMSWIHLDDVLGLFRFALGRADATGPMNATAPYPVTNAEFTQTLGRVLHRPTVLGVPGAALRLALGEVADVLLRGQKVLPERALALGYTFLHPTLEGALRDLLRR